AHHALSGAPKVERAPVTIATDSRKQPPLATASANDGVESVPVVTPSSLPSAPPPPAPATSVTAAPTTVADAQGERALIDTARTALARGLASDALAATDSHAKRFPHGRLAEEREALAVQALVAKGDAPAARTRAARFRRSFPDSIFRAAVDSAVASLDKAAPP
ncbi:MAG TPA: hypothetical protein VM925_10890, partial [Labilithrix sp.]|nr:hypothetical protein [Labilithrix sp.]